MRTFSTSLCRNRFWIFKPWSIVLKQTQSLLIKRLFIHFLYMNNQWETIWAIWRYWEETSAKRFVFQFSPILSIVLSFWRQFHQRSTYSFYICKFNAQLFCAYVLGLYFIAARLLAQKLCVEGWWNWTLVSISLKSYEQLPLTTVMQSNMCTTIALGAPKIMVFVDKWSFFRGTDEL